MGILDRIAERIAVLERDKAKALADYERIERRIDAEITALTQAQGLVTPEIARVVDRLGVVIKL